MIKIINKKKMYKILITTALSQELKVVKNIIKWLEIKNIKVDFFSTWIWNYKTILNLTKYLNEKKYDFIVNIWICWYVEKDEIIQGARIYNISNNKELIVPIPFIFENLESIACSEKIILDKNEIAEEKYTDMESYWFDLVLDNFNLPRIILKVPYDKIWTQETNNYNISILEEKLSKVNYQKLLEEIKNFLDKYKIPEVNFEKYFEKLKLTFSEKLIFQKWYFKFISENKGNFDDFFEKNKDLNKKELLELLK